jgi:hypothetical protein
MQRDAATGSSGSAEAIHPPSTLVTSTPQRESTGAGRGPRITHKPRVVKEKIRGQTVNDTNPDLVATAAEVLPTPDELAAVAEENTFIGGSQPSRGSDSPTSASRDSKPNVALGVQAPEPDVQFSAPGDGTNISRAPDFSDEELSPPVPVTASPHQDPLTDLPAEKEHPPRIHVAVIAAVFAIGFFLGVSTMFVVKQVLGGSGPAVEQGTSPPQVAQE